MAFDFFDFFDFWMFLLLFLVHNLWEMKWEMKKYTSLKVIFFYKIFFICNPKPCINQAIEVNKSH